MLLGAVACKAEEQKGISSMDCPEEWQADPVPD